VCISSVVIMSLIVSFSVLSLFLFVFVISTATTVIYPLSLHDALPISGVENFLTRAVVDAFSTNGRLRVVGPDAADSILEGEVTGYDVQSIAFDATANVRQYRLIVTLNLRYRDVKEEKLLFDRRGYQDRADFRVTGSVSSTIALEQVALSAASVEIARSIVAFTLERF